MSSVLAEPDTYAGQFGDVVNRLPGTRLDWLVRLRDDALHRFLELGFPTTRLENWKYTNIAPIRRIAFQTAGMPPGRIPAALRSRIEAFTAPRLVLINGLPCRELSVIQGTPSISLHWLSDVLADSARAAPLEGYLGSCASPSERAFVAWNTAFFADGAYVQIPKGTIIEQLVTVVHVALGSNPPWVSHPRNLIVAGEDSQVRIAEVFLGAGSVYLTNPVTEIVAAPGAVVDYYKLECESDAAFHVGATNARVGRDSSITSHTVSIGGALARNELGVVLDGEGAHCTLNGVFVVDGHRLIDNHTEIDHISPHTSSRELYKGVLSGYGEAVFNGAIKVRENAQKADALQQSRNLLLSEHAQINAKPELEIRADDVRCAHGATVGQIDREAMFYLRSRGMSERDARRLLVRGFAAEVLDRVEVPDLRNYLEFRLEDWFRNALEAA
jgi:Fe-S cluster assembly protein SufD